MSTHINEDKLHQILAACERNRVAYLAALEAAREVSHSVMFARGQINRSYRAAMLTDDELEALSVGELEVLNSAGPSGTRGATRRVAPAFHTMSDAEREAVLKARVDEVGVRPNELAAWRSARRQYAHVRREVEELRKRCSESTPLANSLREFAQQHGVRIIHV